MGYWTKSRLIFNSFREHAKASIRQVARQTGLSKSSVQEHSAILTAPVAAVDDA
jgi:DNA-binding IclR family transcriptional regulator